MKIETIERKTNMIHVVANKVVIGDATAETLVIELAFAFKAVLNVCKESLEEGCDISEYELTKELTDYIVHSISLYDEKQEKINPDDIIDRKFGDFLDFGE